MNILIHFKRRHESMASISVIIPIYNGASYLDKCLESLLVQSINDLEVILVNDGSTDSSEKIIDKYVYSHSNIFKKVNKENGGQGSARNLGICHSTR